MSDVGETHVVVYLGGVTDEQIDALMERIADACVDLGLAATADDDPVRALIGLHPAPFPDLNDGDALQQFLDTHARFVIPCPSEARS